MGGGLSPSVPLGDGDTGGGRVGDTYPVAFHSGETRRPREATSTLQASREKAGWGQRRDTGGGLHPGWGVDPNWCCLTWGPGGPRSPDLPGFPVSPCKKTRLGGGWGGWGCQGNKITLWPLAGATTATSCPFSARVCLEQQRTHVITGFPRRSRWSSGTHRTLKGTERQRVSGSLWVACH